jgi:hypothetical protein
VLTGAPPQRTAVFGEQWAIERSPASVQVHTSERDVTILAAARARATVAHGVPMAGQGAGVSRSRTSASD